ncbi:MAG TPA: PxKF domain-containing protein, partial [Actinokineospora sp.]|nr:PxKF domain-containing protein [Actinokineospora sp.]
LGEGADQSATGGSTDAAGNTGSAGVSGINVDKTPPTLTGAPSTTGWSSGDVTVTWTCTDSASGVLAAPEPSTVGGEGADLSASTTCTDKAGNTAVATVSGIGIDRAAPNSAASVTAPFDGGWHADTAEVTLTAADALSGVAATYYRVDGGSSQLYSGPFAFTSAGKHLIDFWSVDTAGNLEDVAGNSLAVWIDNAVPTISGSRTPANAHGWNNSPVTVSFACADTQSGVAGCTDAVELSGEGADQSVGGNAVDGVGKTASTTVGGIGIDLTAPTLAPTSTDGWHNQDVTVGWTAADGLSGIDPATQPADSVITGEGRNLGAGPVTVKDKAGNESAPASVTGVTIDRTGPTITGGPITAPNAAGWYRDEVVIDFACTDPALADGTAGSGVATCPTSKVLKTDAANQSVTSDPSTDVAGNSTAGKTVAGINIDGTAPATMSNNQCTKTSGWCTGPTANVVLTAADALSGVKEIHYRVDGGAEQVAAGASKTVSVPLDGSGAGTVAYWAVDNAGNAETTNAVALKWDNIAPAVTHTVSPAPNADDWNNSDTTVHFTAKDDDAGSGLDAGSVSPDVVVSADTAGQVVTGSARDTAGNIGTDSVTVKLDKTKPVINATIAGGMKPWFTTPVVVHFTCSDAGSGIPATACPDDVTLGDGANQSVARTVTDRAGNSATATLSGINVDQEAPVIVSTSVADGAVYNAPPTATCTATDAVSGVDSCTVQVTALPDAGAYAFTATATDNAGNTTTRTGQFRVHLYKFGGFLQPINDPTIMPGSATSVFKTGSTVPVKFQLRTASGALMQARTAPQWLTPVKGSLTTAPVNEVAAADTATTDGTFRWDATAQQYIYNWQTKGLAANYTYRISVRLDDGQVLSVVVGLK